MISMVLIFFFPYGWCSFRKLHISLDCYLYNFFCKAKDVNYNSSKLLKKTLCTLRYFVLPRLLLYRQPQRSWFSSNNFPKPINNTKHCNQSPSYQTIYGKQRVLIRSGTTTNFSIHDNQSCLFNKAVRILTIHIISSKAYFINDIDCHLC